MQIDMIIGDYKITKGLNEYNTDNMWLYNLKKQEGVILTPRQLEEILDQFWQEVTNG